MTDDLPPGRPRCHGEKSSGTAVSPEGPGATPQVITDANEWLSVIAHMTTYLGRAADVLVDAHDLHRSGAGEPEVKECLSQAENILRLLAQALAKALESKTAREQARDTDEETIQARARGGVAGRPTPRLPTAGCGET